MPNSLNKSQFLLIGAVALILIFFEFYSYLSQFNVLNSAEYLYKDELTIFQDAFYHIEKIHKTSPCDEIVYRAKEFVDLVNSFIRVKGMYLNYTWNGSCPYNFTLFLTSPRINITKSSNIS